MMVVTSSPVEIPSVLRHKLGEDGATALTGLMESFWQGRVRELEDAAWRRTEERLDRVEVTLERLVEAQARSEERLDRVEATLERLAEAQTRTEARVEQLAEAQQRTEARLEQLAEAQQRTEARLDQLAEAQQRTEAQVSKLVGAIDTLRQEVGKLSENIGAGLEGIAKITLPGYLERHLRIRMLGPLGEELQPMIVGPEGRELEIDLAGTGIQEGQTQMVVCEVKSRIYSDDVFRFQDRIEQMHAYLPERIVPVLFGHRIHPTAQEAAEPLGILLVGSYQR
jgi:hypothetical protein